MSHITLNKFKLGDVTIKRIDELDEHGFNQIIELEQITFSKDALSETQLKDIATTDEYVLFIALAADEVVGVMYINLITADATAHVMSIVVKGGHRRRGIGRKLLACAEDWSVEQELDRVILEVRASNFAAIALYESCGYERLGVREGFYQFPTESAIVLQKNVRK